MRFLLFSTLLAFLGCAQKEEQKFRIPAEWEEHEAVWIGWDDYDINKSATLSNVIKEVQAHVPVKVAYSNDSIKRASLKFLDSLQVDTAAITASILKGANEWARDYGAIFAIDSNHHLAMLDFEWNSYGSLAWEEEQWPDWVANKYDSLEYAYEHSDRSRVDSLMGVLTKANQYKIPIKLEGGSFEYNGNGVLIQCEAVTLQRNPGKTKEEIETEFKRFGIEKVIWLPQGVIEDEHIAQLIDNQYMVGGTGGHTDEFVRFVDEHTILLAWLNEDEIDDHPLNQENYDRMSRNYEILKNARDTEGQAFKIIKMPMPRPVETALTVVEKWSPDNWSNNQVSLEGLKKGHQLSVGDTIQGVAAAGYLNFLISNGLVLAGAYENYGSKDKDEEAKKILEDVFPNRDVVMIDVLKLNGKYGGGGIHCVSMHEPKVK